MKDERKTFEFEIKEISEEGRFSGYLATFGNVDQGGDIVDAGAFKKTLREKKAFPLTWAHSASHPDLVIGSFTGQEDEKGLLVDGEFFMDLEGGKKAHATTKKLYEKKINMGLSMGYKTIKHVPDNIENMQIRRLKEVRLNEGSLTLFPMNEEARVESIKGTIEHDPEKGSFQITCSSCGKTLSMEPEEVSTLLESSCKSEEPEEKFHSELEKIAENLKKS